MSRFTGKVAIITGSSNGIGRGTALLFAKEGASVTITGRNAERLEETRQEILRAGVPAERINSVIADVIVEKDQERLISSTLEKFGKIDILVNNAGANYPDGKGGVGVDYGLNAYHKIMQLNLQSVIELIQKVRPHLAKTEGEIVNVSSIAAGPAANPSSPYYASAKAALDQYSTSIAIDLIPEGIRVNTVRPGLVSTGFSTVARGLSADESVNFYESMGRNRTAVPAGFCGQPDHIAQVIAFLADRRASAYIIGQTLVADGGSSLVLGMHAGFPQKTKKA